MSDVQSRPTSTSGMTDAEAREFNSIFVMRFIVFTAGALVAHILVWVWRPGRPGPEGYRNSMLDGIEPALAALTTLVG